MHFLALAAIVEYRRKSLEVCKTLIKEGRVNEANVIIEKVEKNIIDLQSEVLN